MVVSSVLYKVANGVTRSRQIRLFRNIDLPWLVPSNVHAVCQRASANVEFWKNYLFQWVGVSLLCVPWLGARAGVINCSTSVQEWSSQFVRHKRWAFAPALDYLLCEAA